MFWFPQDPPEIENDDIFWVVETKDIVGVPRFLLSKYGKHLSSVSDFSRGTPGNWNIKTDGEIKTWPGYCLFAKVQRGKTRKKPILDQIS